MSYRLFIDDELEAMAKRLEMQISPIELRDDNEWLMAEAAATLRAAKGRVRVKALVWRKSKRGFRWEETACGSYFIFYKSGGGATLSYGATTLTVAEYDGEDAGVKCKAAAQADHERRVLANLEPTPAERCAECDCRHGGVECNWIAQQPAPDHARIPALEQALEAMSEALASYQRSIAGERALKKGQTND